MGLRPSSLVRPKISLTWVLRNDPTSNNVATETNLQKKRSIQNSCRTPSEPSLSVISEGRAARRVRDKKPRHRHTRCSHTHISHKPQCTPTRFGYEITDVDAFLTKASLDSPGNIPVVLSSPCLLYQTRVGGYQDEISLPLGMVVNAVFKNQGWLYVQTPHGEEGYVQYTACLPLGILPPRTPAPCWETHTDIFPHPAGNRSDSEKLRTGTRSECGGIRTKKFDGRDTMSACGERSVDRLYLRATASAKSRDILRQTLLVISSDYYGRGRSTLTVKKGDVVALINDELKDWFWVKNRDGKEGFIPAIIAGHGFL
ncbi:SH3 domain-containing protein Dlish [Lycorma delicatula]|uniref:SH3 domain-containing protein Dlish n=1 Tax=Lycorma delicatula TaxID=130591 RepID=UPI003F50D736